MATNEEGNRNGLSKSLPPIPNHLDFRGIARTRDGKLGAMYRFASGEEDVYTEKAVYDDMIKAATWSRDLKRTAPDWSAFYAEASKRQYTVLAKLQRTITRDGQKLEIPPVQTAEVIPINTMSL
ncbi:MAG: hypothetical protein DHS20C09_07550 [marine bacterium B5-7]|nr:MAG: hypothetical protein DHS20C09_07550 [marine bacterium B5-7]